MDHTPEQPASGVEEEQRVHCWATELPDEIWVEVIHSLTFDYCRPMRLTCRSWNTLVCSQVTRITCKELRHFAPKILTLEYEKAAKAARADLSKGTRKQTAGGSNNRVAGGSNNCIVGGNNKQAAGQHTAGGDNPKGQQAAEVIADWLGDHAEDLTLAHSKLNISDMGWVDLRAVVRQFTNLRELTLSRHSAIDSCLLTQLSSLSKLTKLVAHWDDIEKRDFERMGSVLTGLKELDLHLGIGCFRPSLSSLLPDPQAFSRLEVLSVQDATGMKRYDFKALSKLPALRNLTLKDCSSWHQGVMLALCGCTQLTKLVLQSCGLGSIPRSLSSLQLLQHFEVSAGQDFDNQAPADSIQGLQHLTALQHLSFHTFSSALTLAHLNPLTNLTSLTLDFGNAEVLSWCLLAFTNLQSLRVFHNDLTNADAVKSIAGLPKLTCLHMGVAHGAQKSIALEAVQQLPRVPPLRKLVLEDRYLNVEDDLVTFPKLQCCSKLSSLESIVVQSACVSLGDLAEWTTLGQLQRLEFKCCSFESGDSGLQVLTVLSSLRGLVLMHCKGCDPTGWAWLCNLKGLTELELESRQFLTSEHVRGWAGWTNLQKLKVFVGPFIEDACLEEFGRMSGLRELALSGCAGLAPGFLSPLAGLCDLRRLEVLRVDGSSVCVGCLSQLTALTCLRVSNRQVSGVLKLAKLASLQVLELVRY